MRYLDLDKINIGNCDENIVHKHLTVTYDDNKSLFYNEPNILSTVKNCLIDIKNDGVYCFNVDAKIDNCNQDIFLSFVNIFLGIFISELCENGGRLREHRLAAPETLINEVHCVQGLIKKMVNYKTKVDKMQIVIQCKEYVYVLAGDIKWTDN